MSDTESVTRADLQISKLSLVREPLASHLHSWWSIVSPGGTFSAQRTLLGGFTTLYWRSWTSG